MCKPDARWRRFDVPVQIPLFPPILAEAHHAGPTARPGATPARVGRVSESFRSPRDRWLRPRNDRGGRANPTSGNEQDQEKLTVPYRSPRLSIVSFRGIVRLNQRRVENQV